MKAASTAAIGIILGITTAFLAMLATVLVAALSESPASIPLVFSASVGEENGLPSVEFLPNGLGLLAVIAVVALLYTWVRIRAQRHR
ncbi:hypothetical protein [Curtobacterium flaccumfaciens]|uniref:hypothetical protein n=1 Tax=Curtobacterium flaccumfaciens TaxID=2035 RepID=UPI00105D432E|nr:hypothetical protein [Curtobacterium flaccumfaciens]